MYHLDFIWQSMYVLHFIQIYTLQVEYFVLKLLIPFFSMYAMLDKIVH
jgi:hypothetical protein